MTAVWRVLLILLAASLADPARGDEAPPPLPMAEVASGVYVYAAPHELATPDNLDGIGNLGFIVGDEAVAVVDTGGSLAVGRRLLAAIRARTDRPIRYVVNTHVHPDHLLGNAAFEGLGARFVGHANLPEALAARAESYLEATRRLIGEAGFAGTRAIPPNLVVADSLVIDLGGRRLRLDAWPTAHTNGDLTVFDETTATWFLGDLLFVGHIPALDGSLKGWLAVLDKLKARPAARVVPGHGPAALPWPTAAEGTERYLRRLADDVRRMLAEGKTMREAAEQAGQAERGRWDLFEDFNARNATTAYHELEWE